MTMTARKASEIAAALDRAKKELARIADEFPAGYGDRRTKDFGVAIGTVAASAGMWATVMWAESAQLKRTESK